jgi:LysR family transcriptional activator of mexEF-oprN operon
LVAEVDRALKGSARERISALELPQFSALAVLLTHSDLLAVVPDYVAHTMAACTGLRAEPLPLKVSAPELSMVWRGVADNDPAERWLRSRFSTFLAGNNRHAWSVVAA